MIRDSLLRMRNKARHCVGVFVYVLGCIMIHEDVLINNLHLQISPSQLPKFLMIFPILFLKKGIWDLAAFEGGKLLAGPVGSAGVIMNVIKSKSQGLNTDPWCDAKSSAVEISETNTDAKGKAVTIDI